MKTTVYKKDGEFVGTIIDFGAGDVTLIINGNDVHQHFDTPKAAQAALSQHCGGMPEEVSDEALNSFIEANSASFAADCDEIEKAREVAHAAGLPFYDGTDEEFDAFYDAGGAVYDGHMSVEDYKRWLALQEGANTAAQEGHKKRKTTTSTAVKARYNKKHYTRVPLDVPKELAEQFKKKCAAEGTSCSAVLKAAIEEFLKKTS